MTKMIKYLGLGFLMMLGACQQDRIDLVEPTPVDDSCPKDASAGSANFSKYIALGNSLTAGFQAGALFTEGQNNSYPKILAKQFECVGGSTTFNQPDINSVNGCYNYPTCSFGRLILFDDGSGAGPLPTPTNPLLPAPYNTADVPGAYAGDKASLNNFGVPGVKLIEAVGVSNYGTLNPYYYRFASDPSNKTLLVDAAEKQGTFFTMWLGSNDVLKYAASGAIANADGTGINDMTPVANFQPAYTAALTAMLGASAKGAVANIPDVTAIPFFTTISWNSIPLDAETATGLNTQLAAGYKQILDAALAYDQISLEEHDKRLLSFSAGDNGILITDETLTDLTDFMISNGASALVPYARARQTTATDLICLTAGSFLGQPVDITGDQVPDGYNGVSIPLVNNSSTDLASLKGDDLVLIYPEIVTIATRIATFNGIIASAVEAANTGGARVALVDVNGEFNKLVGNALTVGGTVMNGVTINPTFAPPTAAFSEDGVHPNSRGYAYIANLFIDAINAKFSSTIPKVNIAKYNGTALPLVAQ